MKLPTFNEWLVDRDQRDPLVEGKAKRPDYSFDQWLKGAKDLGKSVDSLVGQAKEKDSELDREKDKAEKEPKEKPSDTYEPEPEGKDAWNKLKDIAKERAKEKAEKEAKEQKD
jgi:hypothetical protein